MIQTNFAEGLFNALDTNKNESIALNKIETLLETTEKILNNFEKIAGEDNEITLEKLINHFCTKADNNNYLEKIFNLINENQNGKITKTEIEESQNMIMDIINKFSSNDKITLDELKSFVENNKKSCIEIDNSELVKNPKKIEHVLL